MSVKQRGAPKFKTGLIDLSSIHAHRSDFSLLIYRHSRVQLQQCTQIRGMIPTKWNYWKLLVTLQLEDLKVNVISVKLQKGGFLMQATQRIFNFIILFEHIFFYISILHFLNIIEYLTDLLHCHWAASGSSWISDSRCNLILNYRLALAKDSQLCSHCILRRTLRNKVSLSNLIIYEFIVTP